MRCAGRHSVLVPSPGGPLRMTGRIAATAAATVLAGHVLLRRTWFPALAGIERPGHVALTFDDGPDPASTPLFLDTLDALGVQATFFLVAVSARRHRRLARQIAVRGHELAVHGWRHTWPWLPAAGRIGSGRPGGGGSALVPASVRDPDRRPGRGGGHGGTATGAVVRVGTGLGTRGDRGLSALADRS